MSEPQVDVISRQKKPFPPRNPPSNTPPETIAERIASRPAPQRLEAPLESPQTSPVAEVKSAANKDSRFLSVDLPSRFEFYSFSSLSVKPLTGYHQAKFHRAAREKKDMMVAEAISSLLPDGILAQDLTIPDFYYLMYWLRLTFYTKTQLVHHGVCNNPEHVEKVRSAGKKKESEKEELEKKESLINVEVISSTILDETELAEEYLEGFEDQAAELIALLKPYGFTLTAPRMFDSISLHEEFGEHENYTEIAFLADRASCLMREDGLRSPLMDRIKVIEELPIDVQETLEEWRVRVSMYGVNESVRFRCKGCGADVENRISISAHSFL